MTIIEFARLLARNWSKVVFGGLVLLVAVPAAQDWWKQHQIEVAKQEREQAIEQIGLDASVAGSMYASAYKACTNIGIPNIEQCASYKGLLLQEKAAPVLASAAVGQRVNYEAKCRKLYDDKYCFDLLNRAFLLSQSEP